MSGFEIAGIVIGGWPILIDGLKFYAEERGVIKDFCNCQPLVQSIHRQLKREKVTFENSVKCLINAAAKQSEERSIEEVAVMMGSPGDSRWAEEDSDSSGIFSHKTAVMYAETRQDLEQILGKIQQSLDKVPPKQPNKHTTKRQWERLMLAIKQDQIELQLEKAERFNRFLVNLTRENVLLSTQESPKRSARHYNSIREHALLMANSFHRKLLGRKCQCTSTHNASLVVELRRVRRRSKDLYFRVLFGFDSAIRPYPSREMEVKAVEPYSSSTDLTSLDATLTQPSTPTARVHSSPDFRDSTLSLKETDDLEKMRSKFKGLFRSRSSHLLSTFSSNEKSEKNELELLPPSIPPSRKPSKVQFEILESQEKEIKIEEVENLCVAISLTPEEASTWSGVLSSHENKRQEIRLASKPYFATEGKDVRLISLMEILSTQIWKTKPRSKLGLQLASAVLQLYQTPWLRKDWGKEDIFFVQEPDGTILIDKPLLRPQFSATTESIRATESPVATFNMNVPYLFALGVVLIELHYRKPVEELQNEVTGFTVTAGEAPEIAQMKKTLLMLNLIDRMDAGTNLEMALKQCIKGPDGALTDLNKEELRDMVEEKIIVPLENEVLWLHASKRIEDCM